MTLHSRPAGRESRPGRGGCPMESEARGRGSVSGRKWVEVGVDGSDSSRDAVEWSANQAAGYGRGVRIVTAVWPLESEGLFGEGVRFREGEETPREHDA